MLKLYNTLGRKKEIFKPIDPKEVKVYSCGPTVYNYAHIGNLRTYIFNDLLRRILRFSGFKTNHVMNLTDVDDKTIRSSMKENTPLKDFTRKYENIFFEDLEKLNIERPEHVLRATDNIKEMVLLIEDLLKKGLAYKASDGIYFSISKSKGYGKLAGLNKVKNTKERISADEYDKENPQDFALWKFYSKEDGDVFWEASFGKGRPGWHIECSAMSMKILGSTIDIHTGATDLIFPHHTNEIAQSEGATGKKFVNYWLHAGFLNMERGKMSKSDGNTFYLKSIEEKGYTPLTFRYLCLTTHYKKPLNFGIGKLEAARTAYERLKGVVQKMKDDGLENKKYFEDFEKEVNDDLNVPGGLQVLWKLVRDEKAKGKVRTIKRMDEVLGLNLFKKEKSMVPPEIEKLAEEREKYRKEKDWKKADEIREIIRSKGYSIDDNQEGIKLRKI